MVKQQNSYVCQDCGASSFRWMGRCPSCSAWHTLVEEALPDPGRQSPLEPPDTPALASLEVDEKGHRVCAGSKEMNRVLGGGIVSDSVVLLAGEPGIGKSTLLLQMANAVAENAGPVLYVSGEESPQQLKLRATRLSISGERIHIMDSGAVEKIQAAAEKLKPALVIADSAQTLRVMELGSSPGTVGQVRESVSKLSEHAKSRSYPLFVVSHVTKDGLVAGPKVVEHLVDVVLRMEGDNRYDFRLLRAVKNRFGPTGELGVFEMEARGLKPVETTGDLFRPYHGPPGAGAATVAVCEGTRSLLVEIQALVTASAYQIPNRKVTGMDPNRVALHLALLGKSGFSLGQKDIFVNVAGGFRLNEPAADLGALMAVASSYAEIPLPPQVAFIGEVGLRGELRAVHNFQGRIKEVAQNGLQCIIAPKNNENSAIKLNGLTLRFFDELKAVLKHFFAAGKRQEMGS